MVHSRRQPVSKKAVKAIKIALIKEVFFAWTVMSSLLCPENRMACGIAVLNLAYRERAYGALVA